MTLFFVFAILTVIGLIGYAFQVLAVRQTIKTDQRRKDYLKPVSILKPLKGLDDNLFDNLESFCSIDYPEYEIIFCLKDYNDPAYKVARKVKERHPEKDITIIVNHSDEALNPKINNLLAGYRIAKYSLVLISDSNVMVDKDYLGTITSYMADKDVGIVSNIIIGVGGKSIGSLFENLHMNSFIVGSVCFLDRILNIPCVIGKSMLMRKEDLDAIGGLKAFKDILAEDFVIGSRMHERCKRVVLSNYAIKNVNAYWDIAKFLNRHTRWARLRLKLGGLKYFSELVANPVFVSVTSLIFCGLSAMTITLAILTATIKYFGDLYLSRLLKVSINPLAYTLIPIKDFIIGCLWFVPFFSNSVTWRGNRYIIGKDTILSPYPNNVSWSWRYKLIKAIRTRFA